MIANRSDFIGGWVKFPVNPDIKHPGRYYSLGVEDVQNVNPALLIISEEPWDLYSEPSTGPGAAGHDSIERRIAQMHGYSKRAEFLTEVNPVTGYVIEDAGTDLHLELDLTDYYARGEMNETRMRKLGGALMRDCEIASIIVVAGMDSARELAQISRFTDDLSVVEGAIRIQDTYKYEGISRAFSLDSHSSL